MSKFADTLAKKDGVFVARRDDGAGRWVKIARQDAYRIWSLPALVRPSLDMRESEGIGKLAYVRSPWAKEWKGHAPTATSATHEHIAVSAMNPDGLAPAFVIWAWDVGRVHPFPAAPAVHIDEDTVIRENAGQWWVVKHGNWGFEGYPTSAAAAKAARAKRSEFKRSTKAIVKERETRERREGLARAKAAGISVTAMAKALAAVHGGDTSANPALDFLRDEIGLSRAMLESPSSDPVFWAGDLAGGMRDAIGEPATRRALAKHAPRLFHALGWGEPAAPLARRHGGTVLRFANGKNR